jgi:hypothetical protein
VKYLLTQSEYDALAPKEEVESLKRALESARVLILAQAKLARYCGKGYCDMCPISSIGFGMPGDPMIPHIADYGTSKLICPKHRRYSK